MNVKEDAMQVIEGASVLVTGAASGLGALFARRAADGGAARLSLWDVDAAGAQRVADALARPGLSVSVHEVDLSSLEAIEFAAETVLAQGAPDVVINNAGIVRGAPFWDHDQRRDIEATIRVNTLAPMHLTRALLPAMMEDHSRPKRVLNIVSAAGTLPNPNMSVYAASKWALLGWSESVRLELQKHDYGHVGVTAFCPSYISTGMFEGARGPLLTPIMTPDRAADAAWQGMIAGRAVITKPWTVKFAMAMRGVLPTPAWDFVAERMGVYSSMDQFVGRQALKR